MLNGLDLFSGIGGITIALSEWVRPVAYCEIERYAQAVLMSRMQEGRLPTAPIWDDVQTLTAKELPRIDIIYGGFPCQDISVAGLGKGLEGERSGLFFEIMRLVTEVRPTFIFLENVAAITSRGLGAVTAEITRRGYDCRWTTLSAAEIGANHKRQRWWLLAYSQGNRERRGSRNVCEKDGGSVRPMCGEFVSPSEEPQNMADTMCERLQGQREESSGVSPEQQNTFDHSWWTTEPDVGRVVNGLPFRVDRIKSLGNSVVPACAREAFKELMGIHK